MSLAFVCPYLSDMEVVLWIKFIRHILQRCQ